MASRLLSALVLVWVVCSAHAQTAEAPTTDAGVERHGWAVLPMGEGFALVHLPPRAQVTTGEGFSARADDGEMVLAKELREMPERVVGSGRTAFLVFAPQEGHDGVPMRMVLSVTARPAPMGGRWVTDSAKRLRVRGAITGAGAIVDAVGFRFEGRDEDGCAVLLGDEGQTTIDLRVLDSGGWVSVSMPTGLIATDRARLVASERGLLLVARASDGSGWMGWRGAVSPGVVVLSESTGEGAAVLPARSAPTVEWTKMDAQTGLVIDDDAAVLEIEGRIVTLGIESRESGGASDRWVVREVRGGLMVALTAREVGGRARAQVATGIGPGTRLVLVQENRADRSEADEGNEGDAQKVRSGLSGLVSRVLLVEVSAMTGRVLYEGPPQIVPLISINEYGLLILVAIGAAVGVLVFVLLPEPKDDVVGLPVGTALAEPFRRFVAGSADVAGAMVMASWALGLAADSGLVERGVDDLWTFALTVAIAFVHGTLGEWAFGVTIGKMLLGCRVASSRKGGAWRIGLRQALVRNVVKFAMPPVALFGLSEANGRHRGDVLAGTVVVIRVVFEQGPNGSMPPNAGGGNGHDAHDDHSDCGADCDGGVGGGDGGGDGGDD
jgi:uncharacterized RDD family membrane protein YckC